jgi:hypothetical protein
MGTSRKRTRGLAQPRAFLTEGNQGRKAAIQRLVVN